MRFFAEIGKTGVDKRCDERYNLSCVCGRSSSGRARPCQGRGSEFEPRRPLQKETPSDRMVFLFGMPRAGWNSLPRPARSASNRSVGDGVPDVPSARRCRAGNEFPRRFAPRSKCPWGTPRNDRGGVSTRCHHPTGWCFFSYSARRNSGFRSRRPSSAAAICPSRASRSPLRVPFSVR